MLTMALKQRIRVSKMSKEYLEALKNIKLVIRSGIFYSLNDRERFINDDNFKIKLCNNIKYYNLY